MCTICLDMMYQPVTTECGHTFCKQCLLDAFAVKKQCTICREPLGGPSGSLSLPVNIVLQQILERKYPKRVKEREEQVKKYMTIREENSNRMEGLPVVLCDALIYPGMKTIMTVDTRQLRDLVHVLTTQFNNSQATQRKFVAMKQLTDMRGFVLILR